MFIPTQVKQLIILAMCVSPLAMTGCYKQDLDNCEDGLEFRNKLIKSHMEINRETDEENRLLKKQIEEDRETITHVSEFLGSVDCYKKQPVTLKKVK